MKTLVPNPTSKKSPSRSNARLLAEEAVSALERHGDERESARLVNAFRENPVPPER